MTVTAQESEEQTGDLVWRNRIRPRLDRSVVFVGLMGAGKTTIGRRVAKVLGLDFTDTDEEIERAAGLSISEIFAKHGEADFRSGERRVIARLLEGPPMVLATGGGAFMDAETRANIAAHGVSIWIRADLALLVRRVSRRTHRPLLQGRDPRAVLSDLIEKRYPIYALADIVVDTYDGPQAHTVRDVLGALTDYVRGGGR